MEEAKIREYAMLMKELDLTGIEINEKKGTIRLERQPAAPSGITEKRREAPAPDPVYSKERPENFGDAEAIFSPMVGVFYNSPSRDSEPFVRPGDRVKKGQVVCIIESMKLMNEIQAEEDCVITEALIGDGEPVEYGTRLFAVTA